jgi:hypothetical protein
LKNGLGALYNIWYTMKNKILNFLSQNSLLIILCVAAAVFYFVILHQLGSIDFIRKSLYYTGDSQEYRDYAKWLSGKSDYCNPFRPFFYPLIILISTLTMGFLGIWYVHIVFWLSACILVYLATYRITGKKILAAISFVLIASNISVIGYTAHALTETTVLFFLSILIYLLTGIQKNRMNLVYIILVLSLMVAVKPGYQPIWYLAILSILILKFKMIIKHPRIILWFLLVCAPVFIQKTINKFKHNTFTTTQIADFNLKEYFYRKVKFYVDNDTVDYSNMDHKFDMVTDSSHAEFTKQTNLIPKSQIMRYLASHLPVSWYIFRTNLEGNICSGNICIDDKNNHELRRWTERLNRERIYKLHKYMFWLLLFYLIISIKKRTTAEYLFILFSGALSFYIIISSGITFWAGDRLIAPAITAWASLYPVIIYFLYRLVRDKIFPLIWSKKA